MPIYIYICFIIAIIIACHVMLYYSILYYVTCMHIYIYTYTLCRTLFGSRPKSSAPSLPHISEAPF